MAELAIRVTRVFEAPRERVWREWTEAEAFADWFGGPQAEVPLSTVHMDVREGGDWRLTMLAERGEIQWKGEYLEVTEPERLVFTLTDEPELGEMPPQQAQAAEKGWGRLLRPDRRAAGELSGPTRVQPPQPDCRRLRWKRAPGRPVM